MRSWAECPEWISSHNFAGLSPRPITSINPSPSALSPVSKFTSDNCTSSFKWQNCQTYENGSNMLSIVTKHVFILIETIVCVQHLLRKRTVCDECRGRGLTEWHPFARPYHFCRKKDGNIAFSILQISWCSECESKQKAFMERLNERYPNVYALPLPDPLHNIPVLVLAISEQWLNQYTTPAGFTPAMIDRPRWPNQCERLCRWKLWWTKTECS